MAEILYMDLAQHIKMDYAQNFKKTQKWPKKDPQKILQGHCAFLGSSTVKKLELA